MHNTGPVFHTRTSPGWWLVPPWQADASFSEVVRHFLSRNPWGMTNTALLLVYFEGYQAALEAAPADRPTCALYERWCTDMRECVARCVTLCREKRAGEIRQPKDNVSTMRAAA